MNFKSKFKSLNVLYSIVLCAGVFFNCSVLQAFAQRSESTSSSVIVQPGAPGQPTKILPSTTKASLLKRSAKDVEFMQGMIMHHGQAIEMTDLIASHTQNKNIQLLGERISKSQADEIAFMKRWLVNREESVEMPMMDMDDMDMSDHDMSNHHMLMPGMLTKKQMNALKKAQGAEFDKLFLTGMIQHHNGALVMVKELFDTPGAGQDAELFNFATDADNSQRAEIEIMQNLLDKKN